MDGGGEDIAALLRDGVVGMSERAAGPTILTGATARPTPSTRLTPAISAKRRGLGGDELCGGRHAGAAGRRGRRRSETGTVAARLY
jgi:hypothetical protein